MLSMKHRGRRFAVVAAVTCVVLVASSLSTSASEPVRASGQQATSVATGAAASWSTHGRSDPVLLFAADGMRQDIVER